MPFPHLETDRLHLRPYQSSDAEALHRLWTDPAVRRYLFDDEVVALEFVADEIERTRLLFEQHGYGQWAVLPHDRHVIIGFCGYRHFFDPPDLQLLFGMAPARWGQGFTTEAAHAVMRYGFEALGFEEIRAATDAPNAASIRVLERLGMTQTRRAVVHGQETLFYRMARPNFVPQGVFRVLPDTG